MNLNAAKLTDADKGVDFTEVIQGHVGQTTKQRFTCERSRVIENRALRLEANENIVKDQFGNLYVVFTARLIDGEVYAVTAWVGAEKWTGQAKQLVLVGEYKRFHTFSDSLLGFLQDRAFIAFGRATLAILKARKTAKLPMISANQSGFELPFPTLNPSLA